MNGNLCVKFSPLPCPTMNIYPSLVMSRTSGENIGDSGLVQAYRAWHGQFHTAWEHGSFDEGPVREPLLPGLNFTQEQLFFIGFGQIWAQLIKPAAAVRTYPQFYVDDLLRILFDQMQVQRVRTDPHSPNKYRVEGTLANIPEFAAAFQCKEGTKVRGALLIL